MTPTDIKRHSFQLTGKNSYSADQVDDYLSRVADSYEQVYSDKQELIKKIGILADKIEEYRQDEDNIKITLLNAQRMANRILKEANANAQSVIDEVAGKAEAAAAKIKNDADMYFADKTADADSYLKKAKDEYETKTAAVEDYSKQVVEQAEKKADYIVSDAKIKTAAAIERANAELAALEDKAAALIDTAQSKLDSIKSMSLRYKHDILDVVEQHKAGLAAIEFDDVVYSAPEATESTFKPVEVVDDQQGAQIKIDLDEIVAKYRQKLEKELASEAETVVVPVVEEKPATDFVDVSSDYTPPKKISSVFNMNPFGGDIRSTTVEKTQEPETVIEPTEAPDSRVLSFEEAEAEPDFLEMLEQTQRSRQKPLAKKAEAYEEVDTEEPDEIEDEDDDYTQPSLFEGISKIVKPRQRSADGGDGSQRARKSDENLEFGEEFDIFDGDDSIDSSFFGKFKKKK